MKLLVVIVSYRVTDLTIDCLRSLSGKIERVPGGARVALCENGTGGDAADRLRQAIAENGWGPWVDLTVITPNRGFTGGNNAVIRPALESDDPPEYVLLLNADTIVPEQDSLNTLVAFLDEHPQAGIAGSMLLSPEGTIESTPFRFPGIATELDRGLKLGIVSKLLAPWSLVLPKRAEPFRVGWVSGASLILRRAMLDQIGLLDEDLYTYFDDPDISLRAARAGWETWYVPASRVIHLGGSTTGLTGPRVVPRLPPYWYQARRRFFLKNYGPWYTAMADAAFILGYATWRIRRWIQRKPDTEPSHMLIDSIRHSVFCAGPKVPVVENPALRSSSGD
ncbi:MAG TPA: glycosyltransferase family 2 protein [Isosphaeraceae bacterium]|nr:glycosyltransferase family 2 protein [Isosphaeraceae bacterium]